MALAGSTTTLGGVQEDWAHGETFAGWDNGHDVKRATDTERWASPYRWQAVRWRRRYFELFGSGVPSDPHLHSTYLTRAKRQPDKNIPKFLSDLHLDCDGVTRDVGKECPCGITDVPSRAMPKGAFTLLLSFSEWEISSGDHSLSVYRSGQETVILAETEVLTGADLLPGFECLVSKLFS